MNVHAKEFSKCAESIFTKIGSGGGNLRFVVGGLAVARVVDVFLRSGERTSGAAVRLLRALRTFPWRSVEPRRQRVGSSARVWSRKRAVEELFARRLRRSLARILVTRLQTRDYRLHETARHLVLGRLRKRGALLIKHINYVGRDVADVVQVLLGSINSEASLRSARWVRGIEIDEVLIGKL